MNAVFADTGYWIALWSPDDRLHQRAMALSAQVESSHIVTTEMVLIEVLDGAARRGRHRRVSSWEMLKDLRADANVRIIETTSELFWNPSDRYVDRPDQSWSLTDCASFLTMQTLGIDQALAYDRDFEQAGFVVLLRDQPPQ